jgi:hypothetical protein
VTIKSRAVDNFGTVQNPPAEIHLTVDAPTSTITFPTEGATVTVIPPINITGTASDPGGGSVVKVEVSVDGGATYSTAAGTTAWSFNWKPGTPGPVTIKSRAVDNFGNVEDPPAEIHVTVKAPTTFRVPTDQPTIQSAINVATNGDTVLVVLGTYVENINFKGKAITVTSESGPQVTIIDGGNAHPVVTFNSGEGRYSALNGFRLQNGNSRGDVNNEGGGITVHGTSPTITNNEIRNNRACHGGGIAIDAGSPLIQLNTITGNVNNICSGGGGVGISIGGASSAEILDNVISDNLDMSAGSDGGGIYIDGSDPIIKNNIIKGNETGLLGGGINILGTSNGLIVQNLIIGNQAFNGGGGIYLAVGSGSQPKLVNNTIANNNATLLLGSGIYVEGDALQTELTNNIIVAEPGQSGLYYFNNESSKQTPPITRFNNIFSVDGMAYGGAIPNMTGMNGNISADPLFTNPTQGDYHLQKGSPSIDSGDNLAPNLPDKDLDGHPRILDGSGKGTAIVDMGVYEFLPLPSAVWNFIPGRPRSFTAKIPIGVGSPNTLSSISWAKPFNLDRRRIVKGSSLCASYRR